MFTISLIEIEWNSLVFVSGRELVKRQGSGFLLAYDSLIDVVIAGG